MINDYLNENKNENENGNEKEKDEEEDDDIVDIEKVLIGMGITNKNVSFRNVFGELTVDFMAKTMT